ncbi:PREDICTED: carbohydrate sulfotransferase 7 [Colobus angolensis palliatus]|uniref:carbohydrate sulfotransferase 7 n=1 Tax=Colobus angolensis palliatus TaxID=336983 RepID=UPI0005F49B43|nr:PREDICTED: carbohydrate sulfotransferase 7 [Colobus angolensis palliatus]
MKGRRRRRREYCKFALLLVLYTLVLLLVPSVLDGGRDGDKGGAPGGGRLRSSHASARLPSQRRGGRRGAAQGRGDAAGDGCRWRHVASHPCPRHGSASVTMNRGTRHAASALEKQRCGGNLSHCQSLGVDLLPTAVQFC